MAEKLKKIRTCDGCMAFEDGYRGSGLSGSFAGLSNHKSFCGLGHDIVPISSLVKNTYMYMGTYKPKSGLCQKPIKISDLVKCKDEYYKTPNNES